MRLISLALMMTLSGAALAENKSIPISERAFVDSMSSVTPAELRSQFGEPEKVTEIRDKHTGETYGSVWHYHHINTAENGEYYQTTMLDIVDDSVVTVVFSSETDPAQPETVP